MTKKNNKHSLKGSILVTGGTGSFGQEFVRTIIKKHPQVNRIIVYSRDEFKQFNMSQNPDFKHSPQLRYFIGDVRDKERLFRACDGVDIIIHAAALKQIPSCEYNPFETIKTNINGAQNVIDVAIDRGVKKVVALSTDKACQPINLYGATKLCSDKLFIAGNSYAGDKRTRFSVVRYGNVMGSRGSVVPYFQNLAQSGAKSLPLTDKRMTRFWLKLEEAVDLVLYALSDMVGGELYVKKLPSLKITDLAKAIAPHLPIKVTGVRPGEKIDEMMISPDDSRYTLEFPTHYLIQPAFHWWSERNNHKTGKRVKDGFSYHSGNNVDWLSVAQIKKILKLVANN